MSALLSTNPRIPFELLCRIEKASASPSGEWILEGPISSERKDFEGDTVLVSAVRKGLKMWQELHCPVDWNHLSVTTGDVDFIIGEGIEVFDGPCATGGTVPWIRATLNKSKVWAQKAWDHIQTGGKLFWSIGGSSKKIGNTVIDTGISHVALTAYPVNSDASASISALAKSLAAHESSPWTEIELLKQVVPLDNSFAKAIPAKTAEPTKYESASVWHKLALEQKPIYQIFKTLTAGSGPGLDATGGRALVEEDIDGTVHNKDCECDDCIERRKPKKFAKAA